MFFSIDPSRAFEPMSLTGSEEEDAELVSGAAELVSGARLFFLDASLPVLETEGIVPAVRSGIGSVPASLTSLAGGLIRDISRACICKALLI